MSLIPWRYLCSGCGGHKCNCPPPPVKLDAHVQAWLEHRYQATDIAAYAAVRERYLQSWGR